MNARELKELWHIAVTTFVATLSVCLAMAIVGSVVMGALKYWK